MTDIRFYECAHSTADHADDFECDRRAALRKADEHRVEEYGLCGACDLGLPFGCNHP